MKAHLLVIAIAGAAVLGSTSCRTYYIDRTVYVEPSPTPKPKPRPVAHRPRVDNPDSFDAVTKPTSYSY